MQKLLFQNKYRINSIRLPGWDYGAEGCYFITICTKNRRHYFGKIINHKMHLSHIGEIVREQWFKSAQIRDNIILDEFIIMPDHLHGIIIICNKKISEPVDCRDIINQFHFPENKNEYQTDVNPGEAHCNAPLPIGKHKTQSPYKNQFGPQSDNLGAIIRGFKGATRKLINNKYGKYFFVWQNGYYEDIIKNENHLYCVREYIINNPAKWKININKFKN